MEVLGVKSPLCVLNNLLTTGSGSKKKKGTDWPTKPTSENPVPQVSQSPSGPGQGAPSGGSGGHPLCSFPICRRAQLDSLLGINDLSWGPSSAVTVRPWASHTLSELSLTCVKQRWYLHCLLQTLENQMRSPMIKYLVKALTANGKYYYLPCESSDLKLHWLILALQPHKKPAPWEGVLLQAELRTRAERSTCLSHATALGERRQEDQEHLFIRIYTFTFTKTHCSCHQRDSLSLLLTQGEYDPRVLNHHENSRNKNYKCSQPSLWAP